MNSSTLPDAAPAASRTAAASAKTRIADDMAMLRAAAELTRDLNAPRPLIYWTDFAASALIGYGALLLAIFADSNMIIRSLAMIVSILGLYRAGSFIHELTHIKHAAVPGFRFAWNLIIGIPLLVPSFMYEGLHSLHHARSRYGTADDPEYLPLARMKPWTVPFFVIVSALAPVALLFRFALLAPLSAVIPPLRRIVVERYSGLVINPDFRRRPAEGEMRRIWLAQECAASLWALTLIVLLVSKTLPIGIFLVGLGVASGVIVLNQIRTLVAHLWENDGDVITVTAQFLDSVNVPPPGWLPELWAPVGLRYHAIHHLLPGVPYHALGTAHRRLTEALPAESKYHRGTYRGLPGLVTRLVASTIRGATPRSG